MLLVGQAPSQDSDPAQPFSGRSGAHLIDLSGLRRDEFWARVDAINLLDRWPGKRGPKGDHFNLVEARASAARQMNAFDDAGFGYDYYVLCGRKVAAAFGLDHLDFFALYGIPYFVVIPHPSGANYLWNRAIVQARARAFFHKALPR